MALYRLGEEVGVAEDSSARFGASFACSEALASKAGVLQLPATSWGCPTAQGGVGNVCFLCTLQLCRGAVALGAGSRASEVGPGSSPSSDCMPCSLPAVAVTRGTALQICMRRSSADAAAVCSHPHACCAQLWVHSAAASAAHSPKPPEAAGFQSGL